MSNISAWSTSAASNNAAPPDGWPEGQSPGSVNDVGRENMAAVRRWYVDAQWLDHGFVWTRQSNNSFLISGTATEIFSAGRRLKMIDTTTILGEVIASSPSGGNTLVTVSSSNLSSSLSSGSVGIIGGSAPAFITPQMSSDWQVYATAGTYTWTVTNNLTRAKVTCVGAGGGSAGCAANPGDSGGSGGGGGAAIKMITVSAGELYTVVVGAGGVAGSNAPGAGGTGGTSTFGAILTATGGTGGPTNPSAGTRQGYGGSGSGGDINVTGHFAGNGLSTSYSGPGGGSIFGGGGAPQASSGSGDAGTFGGGASGASTAGGNLSGAAGGAGVVVIEWAKRS